MSERNEVPSMKMKGWFNRNKEGKVIINSNGFVIFICKDENLQKKYIIQLHISEIDEEAEQICFNVYGKDIYIDVVPWKIPENDSDTKRPVDKIKGKESISTTSKDGGKVIIDSNRFLIFTCEENLQKKCVFQLYLSEIDEKVEQISSSNIKDKDMYVDVVPGLKIPENDSDTETLANKIKGEKSISMSKGRNTVFPWCDASTMIFLKERNAKENVIRYIKSYKEEVAQKLVENGNNVSSLKVQTRYKTHSNTDTLEHTHKNVKYDRAVKEDYFCTYEQLHEIFGSNDGYDTETSDEDGPIEISMPVVKDQSSMSSEATLNLKTAQHSAKLEAQDLKIIENPQSCQHLMKDFIFRMDNKSKNSTDMQNEVLQVCMEIRDMQNEMCMQTKRVINLLQEIVTIFKSGKNK